MDFEIDLGAAMEPQGPVVDAEFFHTPEIMEAPLPTFPAYGFDLAPVALNLVPFQQEVALYRAAANSIIINDTASLTAAVEVKNKGKVLNNKLEKMRVAARAPLLEHLNSIQNIFKMLQNPLAETESIINTKQGTYAHQVTMEKQRLEAEAREEQRRLQAQLDAEAREQRLEAERKAREALVKLEKEEDEATRIALTKEIEEETLAASAPTPQVAPIVAAKPEVIRTAHGSSWTQFKWVCEIVNPELVPRDCCEPSQKLLDAKVKGGIRNIEGCVVKEIPITKSRV